MKHFFFLSAGIALLFFSGCNESFVTEDGFKVIDLPDGSTVYMNKYSKVLYSGGFSDRTIFLEGEAYFDVVQAPEQFTINTAYGKISVTGTDLNVAVQDGAMKVEVDEGEVMVNTGKGTKTVKSGQRAVTNTAVEIKIEKAQGKFRSWLDQLEQTLEKAGERAEKGLNKSKKALQKGANKTEKKLDKLLK